jgi:GAF domain-containing protein/HAMP domain-containing protein
MKFWRKSLSARLLIYFLLLAIIPLAIVGTLTYIQSQKMMKERILTQLTTAAILKEGEMNRWVKGVEGDAQLLARDPVLEEHAATLLSHEKTSDEYASAHQRLGAYLQSVLAEETDLLEILLLRETDGEVVFSTNPEHEGDFEATSPFFAEGRKGTYLQRIYRSARLGGPAMTIATPLRDGSGMSLGVLTVHLNLANLDTIMLEPEGLGATGETYLVDQSNAFVSEARFGPESFPSGVHTQGIDAALQDQADGTGTYTNYLGVAVVGAYRWVDEQQIALLAEMEVDEALAPIRWLGWTILLVGVVVTGLVAAIAYAVSRQISAPILALTRTATQMASGDLTQTVDIQRDDEVGALAQALASMAAQFQDTISGLEQRIAERTHDLEHRAIQLATAADVGRAAASILQMDTLVREVVDLVQDRFDLYYAGLFLLDAAGEYAVLRAGTGGPGRIMEDRRHRLEVGGSSMVGAACAQRRAHIALDVGAEAVRFDNPLLPKTRSEMALPLIVGDRVLGALDVQSAQPMAFSDEDIAILQLVADQVAVAIDNARKFSKEAALLEATDPLFRVSRGLTQASTVDEVIQSIINSVVETEADGCAVASLTLSPEGEIKAATFLGHWDRHGTSQFTTGATFAAGASPLPLHMVKEFWTVEDIFQDSQMPAGTRQFLAQFGGRALVNVPLRAGDRVIGFVSIHRATPGPFSAVSIRLYETLADQAAVALERARLFEEAREQTERERMISRITTRMRTTLDMRTALRTAADEMYQTFGLDRIAIRLRMEDGDS